MVDNQDVLNDAASAQLSRELIELSQISSARRQRAKQAWMLYLLWSGAALVLLGTVAIVVQKQFRDINTKLAFSSAHIEEMRKRLSSAQETMDRLTTELQREETRLKNLQQYRIVILQNEVNALRKTKVNNDDFVKGMADRATSDSLRSLEGEVHKKADEAAFDDLKTEVAKRPTQQDIKGLSDQLKTKANGAELTDAKAEIKTLQAILRDKTDKADLEQVKKELNSLTTRMASLSSTQNPVGQNQPAPKQ